MTSIFGFTLEELVKGDGLSITGIKCSLKEEAGDDFCF